MGKADEERLAIGVQKYPCLYDKTVSAFHNKNQKKNTWEAVAKDIGLETGEAARHSFNTYDGTFYFIGSHCRKASDRRKISLTTLSENQP